MKLSLLVLSTLALISACSKVKDFEDRTKSMEKTTKTMAGTTNDMKETTTTMYKQIRAKESEDTRNKKFLVLDDEGQDLGTKLMAAAVFYKSFEFQLWTGNEYDAQEVRETLFLDAANEFTRRLADIYKEVRVKKISPTKEHMRNEELNFYALAATIHYNHDFQIELVKRKPSVKLTSFYDLVKQALIKDFNGEELKDYEVVLVSGLNKEMFIELIKARVDMLATLGLKNLTDKREMTFGQKSKAILFKITKGLFGSVDLPETFEDSNHATKSQAIKYLDGAVKAKNFLKEIEIEKNLEKTLRSAYSNIGLNEPPQTLLEKDQSPTEKQRSLDREEIRFLIDSLK